jgi:ABC-2 type transport system permease protein
MYSRFLKRMRITWVIAVKDMREAIKNKSALVVIGTAFFVVVIYRLMPGLTANLHAPELILSDPGKSQIVEQLETSPAFYVVSYPDQARMERRVAASEAPYLGLVIPADFDQKSAAKVSQNLQGYTIYWTSAARATELRLAAEAELTRLAGAPVHILPELTLIYPTASDNALGNWAALTIVLTLMIISIQLIPNLMLEEKNTHTLDALLISPASTWELAGGKAIAGLFYALLASVVIIVFFLSQILHLIPVLLAIGIGALFMVSVGLWIGLRVESRGQLSILVLIMVIFLFIPVVVGMISDLLPGGLVQVVSWLPSSAMSRLVQAGFGNPLQPASLITDTLVLLAWWLLAGAILIWQLQRMDRRIGWEAQGIRRKPEIEPAPAPAPQTASLTWKPGIPERSLSNAFQILIALAVKDLREALHNKIVLGILFTSLLMVVFNSALPLLLRNQAANLVFVVDEGNSALLTDLKNQSSLVVRQVNNLDQLEAAMNSSMQNSLGVILPADLDRRLANSESVLLSSYSLHWANQGKLKALALAFEQASAPDKGRVLVDTNFNIVYPDESTSGQPLMIGMFLVFIFLLTGTTLTPVLFVEEKENHTLAALLVSPARPQQIVVGKALVGFVFGLLASSFFLVVNAYLIVHWWTFLVTILACLVFTVTLGLLLGAYCENPATLALWETVIMLFFMVTLFVSVFKVSGIPAWLSGLLQWLPGSAMLQLFNFSMTAIPEQWRMFANAGLLIALGAIFFLLTIWKVKSWN